MAIYGYLDRKNTDESNYYQSLNENSEVQVFWEGHKNLVQTSSRSGHY